MKPTRPRCRGFSLIELLVVLAILGILTAVGVWMIGDRRANSVRSVLDEVEGVLFTAQKGTIASNRDVYVSTSGNWLDGTLILDGRPLRPPPPPIPPAPPAPFPVAADLMPGDDSKRVGSPSEVFRSHATTDRDHMSAGVAVADAGGTVPWYTIALGTSPGLAAVPPINGQVAMTDALAAPLFRSGVNVVVINGQTKRFMTGFSVVVVGLSQGQPWVDGPIGVLVAPANGSSIYKFYKSDKNAVWRKI